MEDGELRRPVESFCYDLRSIDPVLVRIDIENNSHKSEVENIKYDLESIVTSTPDV